MSMNTCTCSNNRKMGAGHFVTGFPFHDKFSIEMYWKKNEAAPVSK